tara:strand:+ start:302 stop:1612 length:1311 start_codon:yes stop_codon:yes gene_type:complete
MATSLKRSKGSQSSLRIGTFSFWIKFTTVGGFNIYSNTVENDNNRGYLSFTSTSQYRMVDNDSSGTHIQLRTNRLFRDFNAWYHVVVRIDTTQSTSTDRVRLYVNGVQETSFDQTDYPSQNTDLKIFEGGQTNREYMNNIYGGSASSPNFYLSHFHYADGQSYGPDTFGSTDSSTGEWKINVDPTVTYGNQGFFMFKDDASLNDDSGNSNNWSSDSGTIQKSEDNPSNVFATNNSLWKQESSRYLTHTKGNTMISGGGSSTWYQTPATLAFNSGKFYWECKFNASTNLDKNTVGVIDYEKTQTSGQFQDATGSVFFKNEDGGDYRLDASTVNSNWGTLSQNQILGVAVDMDAGTPTVKFYRDGSLLGTVNASSLSGKFVTPAHMIYTSGEYQVNYGNGYFGDTAISSEGTNALGIGKFEYDVPSGYTALSTKGLNQ